MNLLCLIYFFSTFFHNPSIRLCPLHKSAKKIFSSPIEQGCLIFTFEFFDNRIISCMIYLARSLLNKIKILICNFPCNLPIPLQPPTPPPL